MRHGIFYNFSPFSIISYYFSTIFINFYKYSSIHRIFNKIFTNLYNSYKIEQLCWQIFMSSYFISRIGRHSKATSLQDLNLQWRFANLSRVSEHAWKYLIILITFMECVGYASMQIEMNINIHLMQHLEMNMFKLSIRIC